MKLTRIFHPLIARPSLGAGFAVMVGAMILTPWDWRWSTRAVISWDAGVLVFLALLTRLMSQTINAHTMAQRSRRLDEGRGAVLIISVIGAVAAVAAVIAEMKQIKLDKGAFQTERLSLMIGTVALSWTFVQMIFAVHYAHDYYMPAPQPPEDDNVTDTLPRNAFPGDFPFRAGLEFPGGDRTPDYWDFVHFSIVIGVACATADINITSKAIRRLASAHCVIAFLFNAVILALTINLGASLLQ